MTWICVDREVQKGSDAGGDLQLSDGYSVRFRLDGDPRTHTDHEDPRHGPVGAGQTEQLYSLFTMTFYVTGHPDCNEPGGLELDENGEPALWLAAQYELMICTDPNDPGSSERWSDLHYDNFDLFFSTVAQGDAHAKKCAELYLNDPRVANRDINWDGLADWERSV